MGRLTRVCVVGLKGQQTRAVEKALDGRAKFDFLTSEQAARTLPSSTDLFVLVTKFIPHALQARIQQFVKRSDAAKLLFVTGGVGTIAGRIELELATLTRG